VYQHLGHRKVLEIPLQSKDATSANVCGEAETPYVWNVMPSEIKEEGDQSKWKRQIRSFCANMDSF
jgi:hypothetical protein